MEGQEIDHKDVIENLLSMFGDVVSRDVILAVVEHCSGDLQTSAEAIITIANAAGAEDLVIDEDMTTLNDNMIQTISNTNIEQNPVLNYPNTTFHTPNLISVPNMSFQIPNSTNGAPNMAHNFTNTACVGTFNQDVQNIPLPPTPVVTSNQQSTPSYAFASSQNTGAVPKQKPKPVFDSYSPRHNWPAQIKNIVKSHNEGNCILILLRGAPGSGKSYLARQIIDMCIGASHKNYATHIFSTDDFFMVKGVYRYDKHQLSEAHCWNQQRADVALRQGLSPIIIDNTNIELWEMEPYLCYGVRNGYIIEVIEPTTSWARNANQLLKKTTHDVPLYTIRRHLDNLQTITGPQLIKHFGVSYPDGKVPPVKRKLPVVVESIEKTSELRNSVVVTKEPSKINTNTEMRAQKFGSNQVNGVNNVDVSNQKVSSLCNSRSSKDGSLYNDLDVSRQGRYLDIERELNEMLKLDEEWENGEAWEEHNQNKPVVNSKQTDSATPKPAVSQSQASTPRENFLNPAQQCNNDWFIPPWYNSESTNEHNQQIAVSDMNETATSIESGDTDLQNPKYKIINATPKDINIFHIPKSKEKIPQVRMLDKGTTTNDFEVTGAYRCKNTEQHFLSLRKMFKNIPKDDLRDVFDNCCGDVNWAVDIIIDGMATHELKTVEDLQESDTEEEQVELCDCLAAYNIIPNSSPANTQTEEKVTVISPELTAALPQKKEKTKPPAPCENIKRQIEENFVISDKHYSNTLLKIRKMRRGEFDHWIFDENTTPMSDVAQTLPSTSNADENLLTTGPEFGPVLGEKSPKRPADCSDSDDDDSSYIGSFNGDGPDTVNVNIGWKFIRTLDNVYGRPEFQYPEYVQPNFNIPMSMLNELNAIWVESLMTQMDDHEKLNNKLLQEDEILARRVQIEEEELVRQGKEPEVPEFKEIMDMDMAMSVYQKEIAQWREKEPTDLAARMTRDKLYNLFPDISKDTLSELLMAHDNNFKNTVESLLISTGQTDVLKVKNGLNKFVIEKELVRQLRLLEQKQKELSESEWPCLPRGEKVDMSTVQKYRNSAERQLQKRQSSFERASDYMGRGMPQVAQFYSGLAHYHTTQYERISSLAASCLMQIHASNSPNNSTIDLHFLRVVEAKQSLDLFLDQHIRNLREAQARGAHRGVLKLFFITGRGAHSEGGQARVKPAVRKRLRERGLHVIEKNPGLLTAKVSADDKLTFQVTT